MVVLAEVKLLDSRVDGGVAGSLFLEVYHRLLQEVVVAAADPMMLVLFYHQL